MTETKQTVTKAEARQGQRKKGMPSVLVVSTIAAVIGLAVILALSLAGA